MLNVLELVNPSTIPMEVKVSLFEINGELIHSTDFEIPEQNQVDLILNNMPGFESSPYGLVKIEFEGIIDGRVYYYRRGSDDEFEYAFNLPLSNVIRGNTSVGFNTFQPSLRPDEHDNAVLNWLSVVNLAATPKKFMVKTYDQGGELIIKRNLVVPGFGRADIDGGHAALGASVVGLQEIIPADRKTPYMAQLLRYGSNAALGAIATGFDFAFALEAKPGNGSVMYAPISRKFGEGNWLEVANALDRPVGVKIRFLKESGEELWAQQVVLPAHGQQHYSATAEGILNPGETGVAEIQPLTPNSIVAQSMYYFRDSNNGGSVDAMYGSQARESHIRPLFGSFNLFLNMQNWLKIFNTGDTSAEVTIVLKRPGSSTETVIEIPANGSVNLPIHDFEAFGTDTNTYGLVLVYSNDSTELLSELVRVRYLENEIDFASATVIR